MDVCPGVSIEEKQITNSTLSINYVHPNPATKQVVINYSINEHAFLCISNSLGMKVSQHSISPSNETEITIDISSLAKGVYILCLRSNIHTSNMVKLLIH